MPQATPNAERDTVGGGEGYSVAHADRMWLGSALELAGNSFVHTGDGNNLTTDQDTTVVCADTTTATLTVTLSTADTDEGRLIIVTDEAGNAGTNAITVDTEGPETINGGTVTVNSNYGQVRVCSDGTDWVTL